MSPHLLSPLSPVPLPLLTLNTQRERGATTHNRKHSDINTCVGLGPLQKHFPWTWNLSFYFCSHFPLFHPVFSTIFLSPFFNQMYTLALHRLRHLSAWWAVHPSIRLQHNSSSLSGTDLSSLDCHGEDRINARIRCLEPMDKFASTADTSLNIFL